MLLVSRNILLTDLSHISPTDLILVILVNNFSQPASVTCGVPQRFYFGSLLFLIYVNEVSQVVKCHLFLYADDSCLVCEHKDPNEIEKQLNVDFSNICYCFADNKRSIHFGEDKTKSILFASKFKKKNIIKLNIKYGAKQIKQHSKVKYLGCLMDEIMSGEAITLNVIHKISNKLKFLYRKMFFLTPKLRRLLCNALIQPHSDYACSAWHPNLTNKLKHIIETTQSLCVFTCS